MLKLMRLLALLTAVLMLSMAFVSSAAAVSPSQRECEAAGGTFSREQGTVTCIIVSEETVGIAPEHSNAQRVEKTNKESSKGTLQNQPHHQESSECDGPGKSGDNSANCR